MLTEIITRDWENHVCLADGKDILMVCDFVDNASRNHMSYFLHRIFRLKGYLPGETVAAPQAQKAAEERVYAQRRVT